MTLLLFLAALLSSQFWLLCRKSDCSILISRLFEFPIMRVTTLDAHEQSWPLEQAFRTARGASTEARVVVVTVSDGQFSGRGEAVPITRYQQNVASVLAQLESISAMDLDRQQLQNMLPAGAARNALDCALWDLEAKISGKRVWELASILMVEQVETSFTISLDTPAAMGSVARFRCIATSAFRQRPSHPPAPGQAIDSATPARSPRRRARDGDR